MAACPAPIFALPVPPAAVREPMRNPSDERLRGLALVNALRSCSYCHGLGVTIGRRGKGSVCNCVYRNAFSACLRKYRDVQAMQDRMHTVKYSDIGKGRGITTGHMYQRRHEDFLCDFWLMAKRSLCALDWDIFRAHFIDGRDWRACTALFGIDRALFFERVYRIQEIVGKACISTRPYALYPLDEYFGSHQVEHAKPVGDGVRRRSCVTKTAVAPWYAGALPSDRFFFGKMVAA